MKTKKDGLSHMLSISELPNTQWLVHIEVGVNKFAVVQVEGCLLYSFEEKSDH